MTMLIRNDRQDIRIEDGKIAALGRLAPHAGEEIFDATGMTVSYGFCDVHVHFREPGQTSKETIRTGSMAAARGGYTLVCPMPNLNPVPDSLDTLRLETDIIARDAVVDVRPYASITMGRRGRQVVDMKALRPYVAGFSDDGCGSGMRWNWPPRAIA